MKLEILILGLLNFKPLTGYDMKKWLDTEGRFMRPQTHLSQLYRTLKKMAEEGWVTFEVEERDVQPDLKIYTITPVGQQVFLNWLQSPFTPSFRYQDGALLHRLFFASMLNSDQVLDLIRSELAYRKEQIATYRHRDRTIYEMQPTNIVDEDKVPYYLELIHEGGASSIDHYVGWLEGIIERIESDLVDTENAVETT